MYEAAACGGCRRGSRAPKEWSSVHCSVHVSTRRARGPSVRMQCYAAVPAFPKAVAIEPRDSQGRLSSRLPRTPWDGWGGLKMSNFYVPRRWNYLLAPRTSKGRYRSPTGPLVVPVSMKTVRPRAPPGNAGPARPHGAPPSPRLPLAGDPCGACAHHSRTKVTSAGDHVITSRYAYQKPVLPCKTRTRPTDFLGQSADLCNLGARRNPN